jgi:hypothetical protein
MADIPPPSISYWHVYTDAEGISRQREGQISGFAMNMITAGMTPQWIGTRASGKMDCLFTVLPPGWEADWHENPSPQWIVPLSGCWGVETMDGMRVEMGPGMVSFGADLGTVEREGKRGHRSWTVGNEPAVLMLVQFNPDVPQPAIPS